MTAHPLTRCVVCYGAGVIRYRADGDVFGGSVMTVEACMTCAGTGRDLEPAELEAALEALRNPPPIVPIW